MRGVVFATLGILLLLSLGALGDTVELENLFYEQSFGYSIRYPNDWIYTKPREFSVVFSGREETPAYRSTVAIENLLSAKVGGKYESVRAVVDAYKCELVTAAEDVCIHTSDYPAGDGYIAEFTYQGETLRQWRIVIARGNGNIFHTWAYASPIEQYDSYLPIARAMLDSWTLVGEEG